MPNYPLSLPSNGTNSIMNTALATLPNPWEEHALMRTTAHSKRTRTFDSIIHPGLYSHSGLDVLTILAYIHARPNPSIHLGAVDASCAIVVCDLLQPDQPIIYTSEGFTLLTGYRQQEVLGRNCRFLQAPPPAAAAAPRFTEPLLMQGQGTLTGIGTRAATATGMGLLTPGMSTGISMSTGALMAGTAGLPTEAAVPTISGSTSTNGFGMPLAGWEVVRRGLKESRGHGVDMEVVRTMKEAVERDREVQVEVVNYKKSGEAFVNLVTIIPVKVPGWDDGFGGAYNLSVGFMCDITAETGF
ncbi:hypothetical protein VTI74DRAFT_4218 [Chaetomium olivicolor]